MNNIKKIYRELYHLEAELDRAYGEEEINKLEIENLEEAIAFLNGVLFNLERS